MTTIIGPKKGNPRVYWKDHEHEFPVLARLARDILSISASGAGVKRLFNCARDVCHYRRGNLKPETIRDLMLHLFSSKFELEQSLLDLVKEYLSPGEAVILEQARKPVPSLENLEPISDDEEGNQEDEDEEKSGPDKVLEDELTSLQATNQSKQAQRKRPRSEHTQDIDDEDNGLPLPEMPTKESSTQGRLGRVRKRPKMPDGFVIDTL